MDKKTKNISKTKLREAIATQSYWIKSGLRDTPKERKKLEQWKKDLKEMERKSPPKKRKFSWF